MVHLWIGLVTVLPAVTPIGATLLYGQLLFSILPFVKGRHWGAPPHFQRGITDRPGRVQSYRVGSAFSD